MVLHWLIGFGRTHQIEPIPKNPPRRFLEHVALLAFLLCLSLLMTDFTKVAAPLLPSSCHHKFRIVPDLADLAWLAPFSLERPTNAANQLTRKQTTRTSGSMVLQPQEDQMSFRSLRFLNAPNMAQRHARPQKGLQRKVLWCFYLNPHCRPRYECSKAFGLCPHMNSPSQFPTPRNKCFWIFLDLSGMSRRVTHAHPASFFSHTTLD